MFYIYFFNVQVKVSYIFAMSTDQALTLLNITKCVSTITLLILLLLHVSFPSAQSQLCLRYRLSDSCTAAFLEYCRARDRHSNGCRWLGPRRSKYSTHPPTNNQNLFLIHTYMVMVGEVQDDKDSLKGGDVEHCIVTNSV